MHKPFIIFSGSRTGSTALCKFFARLGVNIADEPKIADMRELFLSCDAAKINNTAVSWDKRVARMEQAFRMGIRLIYLKRRDIFAQAVSLTLLKAFGPNRKADVEGYKKFCEGYELDPEVVMEWEEYIRFREEIYDEFFEEKECFSLFYEDLFNIPHEERTKTLVPMFNFLNLAYTEDVDTLAQELFHPRHKVTDPKVLEALDF